MNRTLEATRSAVQCRPVGRSDVAPEPAGTGVDSAGKPRDAHSEPRIIRKMAGKASGISGFVLVHSADRAGCVSLQAQDGRQTQARTHPNA
jgi:hypothetical protein